MKSMKFALSLAVLATGLLGATEAMAVDETRCSGKDCINSPITQPIYLIDENGRQVIYSEDGVRLTIDDKGQAVLQPEGQSF